MLYVITSCIQATRTYFIRLLKFTGTVHGYRYFTADSILQCLICLYLFQSIYIQNKSEELNQEQRDLKKKSTGKRKSRDTEEENKE